MNWIGIGIEKNWKPIPKNWIELVFECNQFLRIELNWIGFVKRKSELNWIGFWQPEKMELNWIGFSWELVKRIGIGPELIQNWNFKRVENDSFLFCSILFKCICCKKQHYELFCRKNALRIEVGIDFSRIGRNWSELELNRAQREALCEICLWSG